MASIPSDTLVASVTQNTQGKSVLILTADDTQDLEFFYPYYRLIEEGYKVDVVTPKGGEFKAKNGFGLKETKALSEVSAADYDLLYIPGGKAPAALKKDDKALKLTKDFAAAGKPIAAICHGPQVLAAAGVIQGKKISAWPEVEDEVTDAGASYVNEPAVVDGQFITGRWPGDLPAHLKKTIEALKGSKNKLAGGPRLATAS
jgi:protease I